jgi:hypothetical protein
MGVMMAEQLALIEGVKPKELDPYPCRCPYCYRALTRRGGMSVSVKYRQWIQKNQDLVSQQQYARHQSEPGSIQLRPDLKYGLEMEARSLNVSPEELIEQLVEAYFDGVLKRLKRRRKKIEVIQKSRQPQERVAQPTIKKVHHKTTDGPLCQPGFYHFESTEDSSLVTCQNCLKLL